ncbi:MULTISPECIES: type II toxin-antitoxin system HicB family antitoxin [unclassified Pseudomonas]|uniref:type II toxin-antitoxin system HicB family antitoxin n=1 Tax=unclassified Pseudomonas TaxID=196821 RepID=UPI001C60885A|nr:MULTISPECIES: type II toxin-antitoxin system HicB family antitoxin [unclassified Pseudomonas]MBW5416084.1 toxin-antitoxin system HicB family antitoxin [Pseudomonas sp. MAG002Y]
MKPMTYNGYTARIEYSDEDECFVGHIAGISDIVGFHGDSVAEIRAAFTEAVDHYLASCKEFGKEPQKPYSGKLTLRIDPELHAKAAIKAQLKGVSINQFVADQLREAV